MAITATNRGVGSSNTSTSSVVIQPTSGPLLAGSTGLCYVAMDNANAPTTNFTATSFNDTAGNTWRMRVEQVAGSPNANVELALWESFLTVNMTTSDTLTLSLTVAAVAKTWTLIEADPATGNQVTFNDFKRIAAGAAVSVSQVSANASLGDLVFSAVGIEGTDTLVADTDTLNGSWSTAQHTGVGTIQASSMSIISQFKVQTTDASTQTYDTTFTTADYSAISVVYSETDPKIRTFNGNGASATSFTITVNYPVAVGSLAVLCVASDNSGSAGSAANLPPAGTSTVTDSDGNTWTQRQTAINDPGLANQGVEIAIYTSLITNALSIGDTITLGTFTVTIPSKAWALWEFAPTGAGSMSYVTGGVGTNNSTGSPTLTTGSITNGDYVVAMGGAEGLAAATNIWTGDSDTSNGSWSQQTQTSGGTIGAAAILLTSQYKKVTATATQTYNPTYSSAADNMLAWIQINDSSAVGGITAKQKASFFQMF